MSEARSKLEALVTNDPTHPAIPLFLVCLEVALALECSADIKVDAIQHLLKKLEKRLQS